MVEGVETINVATCFLLKLYLNQRAWRLSDNNSSIVQMLLDVGMGFPSKVVCIAFAIERVSNNPLQLVNSALQAGIFSKINF